VCFPHIAELLRAVARGFSQKNNLTTGYEIRSSQSPRFYMEKQPPPKLAGLRSEQLISYAALFLAGNLLLCVFTGFLKPFLSNQYDSWWKFPNFLRERGYLEAAPDHQRGERGPQQQDPEHQAGGMRVSFLRQLPHPHPLILRQAPPHPLSLTKNQFRSQILETDPTAKL
jgi:hypothetical protein